MDRRLSSRSSVAGGVEAWRNVEILVSFTRITGHEHPHLQEAFESYAALLSEMGRSEAEIKAAKRELMS